MTHKNHFGSASIVHVDMSWFQDLSILLFSKNTLFSRELLVKPRAVDVVAVGAGPSFTSASSSLSGSPLKMCADELECHSGIDKSAASKKRNESSLINSVF